MWHLLALAGSAIGWFGVAVCLLSGLVKLAGSYYLFGFEAQSIFIAGIGLIATGALAKLEATSRQ